MNQYTVHQKKNMYAWASGFIDGEGCFYIGLTRRKKMKFGIEVRASFSLSQKSHSLEALQLLQSLFHGGGIRYSSKDGTYKYETRNLHHIMNSILPHFQTFPLYTAKKHDLALFQSICSALSHQKHLEYDGLCSIVEQAYAMNQGGRNRRYAKEDILNEIRRNAVSQAGSQAFSSCSE